MTLKVRCQQCGKQSQFSASDAGMTALCVACGARFVIPPPDATNTADAPPAAAGLDDTVHAVVVDTEAAELQAELARGTTAAAPAADLAPPAAARQPHANYAMLYGLLGSAITVAIVLAAVMVLSAKPTWEDGAKRDVRDLIAKAQALHVDRNYQAAYDAYRKIDERIAGHDIADDKFRAELDAARADRDAVFRLLANAPAPAAVASAKNPTAKSPDADPDEEEQNWPKYDPQPVNPKLTATTQSTPPTRPIEQIATAALPIQPPVVATPVKPIPAPPATVPDPRPVVAAGPPRLARPPITVNVRHADDARAGLTDEAIGRSIQRAVDALIPQFQDGRFNGFNPNRQDAYYTGLNALMVYSLLQSSFAIKDERLNTKGPFVKAMVDRMKAMPADAGPVTYARGIRSTAMALLARPEDKPAWQKDLKYLIESHLDGAYTYAASPRGQMTSPGRRGMDFRWDNSNSQYGLLGVWSLAEIGAEVNTNYWQAVEGHWTRCQNADGTWGYAGYRGPGGGGGRLSMTLAGVASLFVTHDWLDAPRIGGAVGRDPFSKPLAKGLAYLETGDNAVDINGGYTLYGLERVGLASGFKFFGDHDWYRELATAVVRRQNGNGEWGGDVETAYHLLFLARGRHPVLMNKLRYDGNWANRPRDVANLARFGSKELERPLNWQVVPITRDWTDWMDSPILYIGAHQAVKFTDPEVDKIRNYVRAGGLLFTQADGSRPEADRWARDLAKRLFPAYEMKELRADHELYNVHYKPTPVPALFGVSNGARLLMVHTPADFTQFWQMRQDKTKRPLFELGMNLYLYAAGKTELRNRLTSTYVPPQGPAAGGTIKVARVKYAGNWDPEPMAWERFSRLVQRGTDVAVNVTEVDLDQLSVDTAPFAHWTGTDAFTPTPAQLDAVKRYVEAGGVLLIDPCGGGGDFFESAKLAVQKAFPKAIPQLIPRDHPMLKDGPPGMEDLSTPLVRTYAKHKRLGGTGRLEYVDAGKGKVIYTPLDITNGLLGCNTWGVIGFDPTYATALTKNILLWSATGMKE